MKTCQRCKQAKPYESFSKASREKDGYSGRCKACVRAHLQEVASRQKVAPAQKTCTTCRTTKAAGEFFSWKYSSDGLCSNCKKCSTEKVDVWVANNPERASANKRRWVEKNPEKRAAASSKYMRTNTAYYTAVAAKYRAMTFQATPKWLSEDDHFLMHEAYELAQERGRVCGGKWEVDHIVPLRGKTVAGLHVPWNLQVIPRPLNRRKSNRHDF